MQLRGQGGIADDGFVVDVARVKAHPRHGLVLSLRDLPAVAGHVTGAGLVEFFAYLHVELAGGVVLVGFVVAGDEFNAVGALQQGEVLVAAGKGVARVGIAGGGGCLVRVRGVGLRCGGRQDRGGQGQGSAQAEDEDSVGEDAVHEVTDSLCREWRTGEMAHATRKQAVSNRTMVAPAGRSMAQAR